jgi:predicted DNA binding CopG/RHH family protein
MWPVVATQFLKTRVSPDVKHRVQQAATQQLITESTWLKQLVIEALGNSAQSITDEVESARSVELSSARDSRLYVRLRHEDRLLLRERAAARGMVAATYVSVLVRSHLRNLAPLPREELSALKRSVAELGAIGRNMNQMARAASQDGKLGGPIREDLWAVLRVAEALRDHVKALLKANLISWRDSDAGDRSR